MDQQETKQNTECKSDKHNQHLCFLMYEGFHLKNKEQYKDIVHEANFRCQYCGRTAKNASNLCAPIEI